MTANHMKNILGILTLTLAGSLVAADDAKSLVAQKLAADYPELDALYKHLHAHPELSLMEEQTAARLAAELRAAGYTVTEKFGGTGIVGVLKNGPGPVVYFRTDLDGLPVAEETGLPYASTTRATNLAGQEVSVMQACGHDIHMTVFTGTARIAAQRAASHSPAASARSVLVRCTYGRTSCAGSNSTPCPRRRKRRPQ